MIKCPKHPQRRRKDCATCQGPEPVERSSAPLAKWPHVTEDGLSWLDPDGNPPVVDERGRLKQSFRFQLKYGAVEQWAPGLILPLTPKAYQQSISGR